MTAFLEAMRQTANKVNTLGQRERDAAAADLRNAIANNFGDAGQAAPALAVTVTVAAQALADLLLQVKPGVVQPIDLVELFALELGRATQRQAPALNGLIIAGGV